MWLFTVYIYVWPELIKVFHVSRLQEIMKNVFAHYTAIFATHPKSGKLPIHPHVWNPECHLTSLCKKKLHIGGILEVNPAFYTKPSHVLIVGATHSLRISWWNPGHRWSPGVPGVPGVGWNRAQRLSDSECSSRCWRFAKFTSKPCLRRLYCCFVIGKLGNCSNSCYGFILMAILQIFQLPRSRRRTWARAEESRPSPPGVGIPWRSVGASYGMLSMAIFVKGQLYWLVVFDHLEKY